MIISKIVAIFLAAIIPLSSSKVYSKCELARELEGIHGIDSEDIGTFVCIAEYQSRFNSEIVGQENYYGLFQISSDFWCDKSYGENKACNMYCSQLLDDDLSDDMQCVQKIVEDHTRYSGNGFTAWPSGTMCQSISKTYLSECSIESKKTLESYQKSRFEKISSGSAEKGEGKVYERCELARELKYQHNIDDDDIATWTCIAKHESDFNTSAIGRLNWDGSEDHGIFQISDIYWCGGYDGKGCGVSCEDLRDNDIKNDVECILKIHNEHQRLFDDGFQAWAVYPRCKGQSEEFVRGCFDTENEVLPFQPRPGVVQPKVETTSIIKSATLKEEGKVYERCELALELRDKFKIPTKQIATWVCIASHESNYNTSAIGRLNWDGSEDHGIFQISDLYWCSTDRRGKGCNLHCSEDLEDSDISNDVECMLKIYEEHKFLSGDGFNAWTTYGRCKGSSDHYLNGCFQENFSNIIPGIQQPSTISQHHTTTSITTENYPTTTEQSKVEETTTTLNSKKPFTTKSTRTKAPFNARTKQEQKKVIVNKSQPVATLKSNNIVNEQKKVSTIPNPPRSSTVGPLKKKPITTKSVKSKNRPSFDIFSFYLSDFTSKPTIDYKPIQFDSKKSSIIINRKAQTSREINSRNLFEATTKRSSYSLFDEEPFKSIQDDRNNFQHNRVGRVVGNITPHSLDYLLKLTTPRVPNYYGK